MIVVSDSSPLIALASIGRLDLLERYCGHVLIPPAVFREIVTEGGGRAGAEDVRRAAWIRTVALQEPERLREIDEIRATRPGLGMGEIEAMVLAHTIGADWILIDDPRGRRLAADRSLNPSASSVCSSPSTGTGGFSIQ